MDSDVGPPLMATVDDVSNQVAALDRRLTELKVALANPIWKQLLVALFSYLLTEACNVVLWPLVEAAVERIDYDTGWAGSSIPPLPAPPEGQPAAHRH